MTSTSTEPLPRVAFLGLGAMGLCMSTHLYCSRFPLTGYDIFPPTLEKFSSQCAAIAQESKIPDPVRTASSPREAVKGANVVVLMVATHAHVESALFTKDNGAVYGLEPGAAVLITATVPPLHPLEVRKRLDEEFGRKDVALVDAPVSGGIARAIDGTLTIMASSDVPATLERADVKTVLDALAGNLAVIPGGLGSGTATKALNQVCCGIHIVASSEIMGIAAILGLDTKKFYDYQVARLDGKQKQREGWCWMFEARGPRMLQRQPPLASATAIIHKDVKIITSETTRLKIDLPLVDETAATLDQALAQGLRDEDDSCIVKMYLAGAGENADLAVAEGRDNSAKEQDEELVRILCDAHSCIHIASAYETVVFGDALNMSSPEQRKQWFGIISGAAGGSTMFYETVPALFNVQDYQECLKRIANPEKLANARKILDLVGSRNYDARILKLALKTLEGGK